MNDKLKEFYSVLQEKNFKLPEYDVFAKELEDPAKSYALYDLLGRKKFKLPEYDIFVDELGLKKKEEPLMPGWESIKNMSKTFSTIAGDIPKLEEKEEKVEGVAEKPIESKPSDLKYPHWTNVSKALGIPVSKEIEKIADFYGVKVSELGEPEILKEAPDTFDEFLAKAKPLKGEEVLSDQTRFATKLKEKPIVNLDDYFRKRNVNPEDIELPAEVNTERWLSEGEKEKLDKILIDKGLYKPPDYTRKSYVASVAKGFNEGMANMVRDIGYLSGAFKDMEKMPLKLAAKITGVEKKVPSEVLDKYYEQLLSTARPNLGATGDDYESIAKFLENIGGDIVPDDRLGEALRNTGHFIPDLLAMTFLPEAKIPLLVEYGLRGTLKFPAYLGFKSYIEAAKEGEGAGGAAKAGAKGVIAGLEYGAIGVEAKQLGEIAKSFGAGMFKTEAVEALANSLGFAAVTKAEGGDVLQGALEGLTFYGLGKIKDIPKDMANALNRRVFNSYLTATDNNIRNVAQMRKDFDPFKARQESVDLWRQYMTEKDPAKRETIARKKNVIDNIININAATNLVLKYPDKFIRIIKDNPLLSEKEKKVWINRFSRTIEDADPRIEEARVFRDEINNLKSELVTYQEDLSIAEDVRTDKVKAINARIEELQKNIDKVMAKPLEDYFPEIKPQEIKDVEEKKPKAEKKEEEVPAEGREKVLKSLEEAIKRTKESGDTDAEKSLTEKYNIIKKGGDYKLTDVTEKLIRGVGAQFGVLQHRQAMIDNYQRQLEAYEKNPSEERKAKILKLEKELGYAELGNSYFTEVPAEEKLSLEGKEFASEEELFKYLDENVLIKEGEEKGTIDQSAFGKEEMPNLPTMKAISKWKSAVNKKMFPEEEKVPEEKVIEETEKKVSGKLNKQRAIKDDKIFKEQKNQLLDTLIEAEDILLGKNKEQARKIEADFKGKDQDFVDRNFPTYYEHKLDNLPPEIEKKLNSLGIKVKEGKLVIDVYKDGTVEVGDIRSALRIIDKGFPKRLTERRYTTGPGKPDKDSPEAYASFEDAEKAFKMAEGNLDQANKHGTPGLKKLMKERYDEAVNMYEGAKTYDYAAKQKQIKIDSDVDFNALWDEFKDHFGYENIGRNELYDIIERQGRPKDLDYNSVQPLVIKDRLDQEKKTIAEKRTELEQDLTSLEEELKTKFGRKDGEGLKKPKGEAEERDMRYIRNRIDKNRSQLIDLQKFEPAIKKLYEAKVEEPISKPDITTGREGETVIPRGAGEDKAAVVKPGEEKPGGESPSIGGNYEVKKTNERISKSDKEFTIIEDYIFKNSDLKEGLEYNYDNGVLIENKDVNRHVVKGEKYYSNGTAIDAINLRAEVKSLPKTTPPQTQVLDLAIDKLRISIPEYKDKIEVNGTTRRIPTNVGQGLEKYKTDVREFLNQIPRLSEAVSDKTIEKWYNDQYAITLKGRAEGDLNNIGSFVHDKNVEGVLNYFGKKKPPPKGQGGEGVEFDGKTYRSIDEVQDAFDKGEITFEQQKPLIEKVREIEKTRNKPEELSLAAKRMLYKLEEGRLIAVDIGRSADMKAMIELEKAGLARKTILQNGYQSYEITETKPPSKPEGLPQRKEGLGARDRSWRAKNKKAGNDIKTDTKEDAEKMSFSEPLPLTLNEDPNYAASDLNNKLTLAGIGRNLAKNLGRKMGGGVRFGMIKRFMRRAEGIFFPDSGIVRIKGIKDFRVLCHELGHWIDFHVFGIRDVVGAKNLPEKYPDIAKELRTVGVKHKGRIYRDLQKLDRDVTSGRIKQAKGSLLRINLESQLKARDKRLEPLRKKYGEEIVAGVMQRDYFQKELKDYLIDINYPMTQRKKTEAIAEFIYNYVVDPASVQRLTPKFHAWFEKLLETAPQIKDALLTARSEFKEYDAYDPRNKRFIETKKKEPWLEGLIKSWDPNKFLYSYVNHLQYMKNLAEEWRMIVGGNAQSYKDPYISAKAMMGIDGRAQQWLLHHPYFHRGTDFEIKKDIEGLIPILKPIIGKKEYGDYSDYLLALDSRESHQNKRPNEAPIPLDLAKAKIDLYEKQYGVNKLWDFQSKIQAYNESLIDFLVESGKLSKEVADLIKSRHQYYVPLKRVFEEFEVRKGAAGTGRDILATSEKALWSRVGSERNVKDIFASMIENTYNILSAGEHNILNTNIKDALFDIQKYSLEKKIDKSLIQEIPGIVVKPYFDASTGEIRFGISKEKPLKGKILTVWEEGKPKYYDVDAELYNNLFQHEPKVTAIIRFLSNPSRWLQAGAVVYDPTFPVRNIVRDQISGRFYSKYGYSPADFIEGIFHAVKKDDIFQKWMASGGDQSFLTAADKLLEGKYAERKIGRPLQKKWKTYTKNPLLALQDFSRLSEIGTRLGAFHNAYKKTKDANLAGMESRDISADYGIHGAMIRNILPLYPFLNARLQHTRMMTEVMVKHPVRFFMRGMEITAIGVLNWFVNNRDEESRKLYQSLPAWRRLGMFNIRIPGTDNFLPLPKGFLGVLFASSAESALDWAVNDDPRAAEDIAKELFKEYSPIGSATELLPHIGKIITEVFANKVGYTGKPIIPEALKLLEKEEQYLDSTPEIFKAIGKGLNISPLRMTYLTRTLFGGAGIGAINILDETLQAVGLLEDKPDDTFTVLSRMPFTKAFFTETPIGPYSAQVGDFYETLDKITKLNRTVNDYVEKGNFDKIDKLLDDPEKEKMYVFYEGNSYAINKFREIMSGIRDIKIANIKDDLITKEAARAENVKLDRLIHETAIQFKDAWTKGESFNLTKEMQDVMDKISKEKGGTREEIEQFKNTYNPYWLQLREKDKDIYDLLREHNGLRDLEPTRKIKDDMTGDNVTLKFQNARRFNEEVVSNYAEEVKNVIGGNADSFKAYDYPSEANPEETELERLLQVAWERALNTTRNTFKIPEK